MNVKKVKPVKMSTDELENLSEAGDTLNTYLRGIGPKLVAINFTRDG